MTASTPSRSIPVHILALPEATASVTYGLFDVLASAGVVWPMLTGRASAPVRFDVRIVAETAEPFGCFGGMPVTPHAGIAEAGPVEIVIVTDPVIPSDCDPRGRWPAAVAWLKAQYAQGALICSVCTGSLLIAATGLLNDGQATTHWAYTGLFARHFPRVKLLREAVLVRSGRDGRIVTGGGVNSWQDLVLHLIARYCGREEAIHIAKVFVMGDRSLGQLAFAAMPRPPQHHDSAIAASQGWAAEHYAEANAVAGMAARSGLAERTFKRRFRAATGYAPIGYVQSLRVEEARQLLETTVTATDTVGAMVGYEDPASFRRLFKRQTGLTPAQYRRRFRRIGRIDDLANDAHGVRLR
jgi:transcriptional regulator GlxA family with amidase domain